MDNKVDTKDGFFETDMVVMVDNHIGLFTLSYGCCLDRCYDEHKFETLKELSDDGKNFSIKSIKQLIYKTPNLLGELYGSQIILSGDVNDKDIISYEINIYKKFGEPRLDDLLGKEWQAIKEYEHFEDCSPYGDYFNPYKEEKMTAKFMTFDNFVENIKQNIAIKALGDTTAPKEEPLNQIQQHMVNDIFGTGEKPKSSNKPILNNKFG